MNRIIKFRVWDTSENKMTNWDDIKRHIHRTGEAMWFYFGEDEIMIPMQFTGLYDKNGKEIYEGDIVLFTRNTGNYQVGLGRLITTKHCIVWDDECCKFGLKYANDVQKLRKHTGYIYEVIGNIYQNADKC